MIIYQLHPRGINFNTDLYESLEGAEQNAQRILEEYLAMRDGRDVHPDDDYPLATSLVWEDGEDGFGNWIRYATFCKDWWGTPEKTSFMSRAWDARHDRFVIRKREVHW